MPPGSAPSPDSPGNEELLYLEALRLTRTCLEGRPYKPFRIWW